jgi:hypothetical protein
MVPADLFTGGAAEVVAVALHGEAASGADDDQVDPFGAGGVLGQKVVAVLLEPQVVGFEAPDPDPRV